MPSTVLILVISTMAGYTFARLPFFGRTVLFYLVVLGLLVPFFTYMIPLYFQLRSMHLLDTLTGAILVLTSTGISFGTFFMRAFFSDLPDELRAGGAHRRLLGVADLHPGDAPAGHLRDRDAGGLHLHLAPGTTSWCRSSTSPAAPTDR